nr:cysteine peptidase family C39 domain-containing protein [uncultured Carboxylicivirga sp.]
MSEITLIIQPDTMDCGPTCLQMISKYYGRYHSLDTLRKHSYITREGVSMLGISDAAEAIGFRTMGVNVGFDKLVKEHPVPFIAHWNQQHFVVVYKIEGDKVWVADPAHGKVTYTHNEFITSWASTKQEDEDVGVCLLLEPTPEFYNREDEPFKVRNQNGKGTYVQILKNIIDISQFSEVVVRINYDNKTLKNISEILDDLKKANKKNIYVTFKLQAEFKIEDYVINKFKKLLNENQYSCNF